MWKRLLSAGLAILILFQVSGSALAYVVAGESTAPTSLTYTDAEGNTQTVDENWAESFPYGAFAFETSGMAVKEGESGVIKVYRLGGTTGRATAYLSYEPVLIQGEDGEAVYDYAISADDVNIQVEDPLPRAQYDPVGMPPAPQVGNASVSADPDEQGYILRLSQTADAYQWQILYEDTWQDIDEATTAEVPADLEFIDSGSYDYRCVYTVDGVDYCSVSLLGETYERPEEEVVPEAPADLDLNAEPTYTALDLQGEDDPYSGWAFELIFAEGEWVKEIHVDALPDELAEAEETAALTIWGCEGGQVLEGADTLLLRVEDTNEPEPSTLGFIVSDVTVDKADGTAEVTIQRVGGTQTPVTVQYATVDGTALAGQDYAATSGTLMFYAGVTSLPVTVELIDDGVATDEQVWFDINLSELLGDDDCQLTQSTVRVSLFNSGTGTGDNLATQLYDPEAVDVSSGVVESGTSANSGSSAVSGTQQAGEEPESVYSTLVDPGSDGDLSLQSYAPSLKVISFANPSKAWGGTVDAAQKGYWEITDDPGSDTSLNQKGDKVSGVGKDYNGAVEVSLDKGIALFSRRDATAKLKASGWEAMGGSADISGQLFSGYNASIETRMGHDTASLSGGSYLYSYTMPRFILSQGSWNLIYNPRYINRYGSGPLDKNWTIRASDDNQNFKNPFSGSYSGSFSFSGKLDMVIDMPFQSYSSGETDTLNDKSMVWLKEMKLTRRTFASNAFYTEVSTPNDANTAPDSCAVLTDSNYSGFQPKVEIVSSEGGVADSNRLYVGSTIKITAGTVPAGYQPENVVVYQSTDGGATWNRFTKFGNGSYDAASKSYTFTLVGSASNPLNQADLNAQYKFRVCYSRTATVTVDFSPSIPRAEDGQTIDTTKYSYPLNGYNGGSDHGFTTGVNANITYGYSTFDSNTGDFSTTTATTSTAKPTSLNDTTWSFSGKNLQWVEFNLDPDDLLLINGKVYPGNQRIYLRESDLAGNLSVIYYHEDYQTGQSAMTTAISWMAVYWDGNGNGKIDGSYNETNSSFTLDETSGDQFCGYIEAGSINETLLAPRKNADGKYCQYFIKVCYTMTPRSLVLPEGASDSDRAQVLPAFTTSLNRDSAAYSQLTDEQKGYRYIVSGKTKQSSSAAEDYSSDNHVMYGEAANARTTLDIPLGGDYSPPELKTENGETVYTWSPNFQGKILYTISNPEPITIENSVAGPTEVTSKYTMTRDDYGALSGYTYTADGLNKMNGYLSSFTGATTFALVSQEQELTTDQILQNPSGSSAVPDSVTLSGYSTFPDAEYLKQMSNGDSPDMGGIDMDESGSSMPEFNLDLGIDLGSTEIAATDYVTILMNGNQVGFAIGLPLGSVGKDGAGFADTNKDAAWTQFQNFFKQSQFRGDESYKKAQTEYNRTHPSPAPSAATGTPTTPPSGGSTTPPATSAAPQPSPSPMDKSKFRSMSFSVGFAVGMAFLFEYNPLDNDYYFEGMTISCSASLSFRLQFRLTVCPVVYVYFQVNAGIEAVTGLGVIRDSVEVDTPRINAKNAATVDNQVKLTYMTRPSATGAVITQADYDKLSGDQKQNYSPLGVDGYYYDSATYSAPGNARDVYLETRAYFLTGAQYGVLTDSEKESYTAAQVSGGQVGYFYNSRNYNSYDEAMAAYEEATSWSFITDYKAFNIRFDGKISIEVYQKDGDDWVPSERTEIVPGSGIYSSEYLSGFLTSDGKSDTQVVLKTQDGMKLNEEVKVVIRALDYDEENTMDVSTISYLSEIQDIRNEVYWKGISITPSLALEIGAGLGVELLKLELYAKASLDATFLLGVYNENYDPYDEDRSNDNKYEPAEVDSFNFSIGLGLRVVLLFFTFEMDAISYNISYDGETWSKYTSAMNSSIQSLSEDGYEGVTIRLPQGTEQKLYTPQDNAQPELSTQAYDPTDPNAPFQLSGYGSSVDAASLGTDLLSGADYKVVSAGDRDFIVYTISRSNATGVDVPQLVMSELTRVNTGTSEAPAYKYGLANPYDNSSSQLYIVLDDDATGDLEFDVWVEEASGSYTIHAAWVSYDSQAPAEPSKPSGNPYGGMNADNYQTIGKPETSSYYTATGTTYDKAAYDGLTDEQKGWCEETVPGTTWTEYKSGSAGTYGSLAEAKAAYTADLNSYNEWFAYYESLESYNAYLQTQLKTSAQNTVLKTAAWSYTPGADGAADTNDSAFSSPVHLGGDGNDAHDSIGYVFAPASLGDGSTVFFGSTLTQDDGTAYKAYTDFLDNSSMADEEYLSYLKAVKKSTLDTLGTRSNLNLAYQTSNGSWMVSSMALTEGQTLSNVEFTQLDGAYYLAYTTQQDTYADGDHITVNRLFLRKVTMTTDENNQIEIDWGTPYLLRTTRDYDLDSSKDGVYNNSGLVTAHDSPYFSNLSFLTAQIDADMLTGTEESFTTQAVAEHTFLLFEMNGATYIILDDSLESITTSGTGTIHPFFTGQMLENEDGSKTQDASGKLEVTIGADQDGNLFAVYVGSVPNTTNNALYLSAYDANTNTWGDGVMLAMRNMDTYEASIRYGWGDRTTQAAYYNLTEDEVKQLYPDYADDIIDNLKAYPDDLGDKNSLTFSNIQAIQGVNGELLVVTQGALSELEVASYTSGGETKYTVMPKYDANGMNSSLGMYAISYSKGSQKLGEGDISFGQADFGVGSELYVSLSVVNTGDTAFRGSENQPITATLSVAGKDIAAWTIQDNIRSGQTLMLDGDCLPLPRDLQTGDKFTLTLTEDQSYAGGSPVTIDLFTVEELPDLGVEDLKVSVAELSADGTTTTLNVEFTAANRGSADAKGVYAQFAYATGTDANGETTYAVLPLTNNNLTVDQQVPLTTQDASTDTDLANGILRLYNATDGSDDLSTGYGRKVHGTIQVPSSVFTMGESEHFELKIELFSAADSTSSNVGLLSAEHKEYNSANNAQTAVVQALTNYTAPPSLIIPMGTTTLIPVSAVSSRGTNPALSVTEIGDEDGMNISILNYRQSSTNAGATEGVLSITPSKAGTGVIHLYDADTESEYAVAFTVTDAMEGIDIYNDNGAFTFKNVDGSVYDENGLNQNWKFQNMPSWGEGSNKETPLRGNLSYGETGATFTFRTVAESFDLYFDGTVEITSSDYPGFRGGTYTGTAGSTPTRIELGTNPDNTPYTITVKVTSEYAWFDRMVEQYAGGTVPVPDYDGVNPLFIWSRSFPATASIDSSSGTTIPLSVYVLDNNGLSYLSINGTRYDANSAGVTVLDTSSEDSLLWRYDFGAISANGNYEITAADISGNTTSTTLIVDWFNTSVSGDPNTVSVPQYDADFYLDANKWNGTPIGKNDINKLNITFTEEGGNQKKDNNTHEVYSFDGSGFTKMLPQEDGGAVFKISGNGIYWTRTVNSDNTWTAKVMYMGQVDGDLPGMELTFNENTKTLMWSAYKEGATTSNITNVAINGYKVNTQEGKNLYGSLPISYNGTYTLTATDAGGNENQLSITISNIKLDLTDCTATPTGAWNQDRTNGKVDVDLSTATGGTYNEGDSNKADNSYLARYETTIVPADYDLSGLADDTELAWTAVNKDNAFKHTYENLKPGDYLVVVRDAVDTANVSTLPVTVADDAIVLAAAVQDATTYGTMDGQILASLTGGNTRAYEFAIIPASDYKIQKDSETEEIIQPTLEEFLEIAETLEEDLVWYPASDAGTSLKANLFEDLDVGQYMIAARGIYADNADSLIDDLIALSEPLRTAKEAWAAALEEAENPTPGQTPPTQEELEQLKQAVETAQAAYDAKAAEIRTASAPSYGSDTTTGYWTGVDVVVTEIKPQYVSTSDPSNLELIGPGPNDSVVYHIKSMDRNLTISDRSIVVQANKLMNVVLTGDGFSVFIPKGTLETNFNVNRLIIRPSQAEDGMVVQYTDQEGNVSILPWCLVSDESVQYIVVGMGDYTLVPGNVDFDDIAGLWGTDYIDFTSRRELFQGTGENLFSPDMPMSRAMFVTVLWRMAGSPAAEGEVTFTDLTDDWYRDAVQWAVANGIAEGYNAQTFGPNDLVNREQMCVFLGRFLDYLGWTLNESSESIAFADSDSISPWATEDVDYCTRTGLVEGVGENTFAPLQSASRMEVSTLLARFVTKLVENYCDI